VLNVITTLPTVNMAAFIEEDNNLEYVVIAGDT
jgi:hypothetical protein